MNEQRRLFLKGCVVGGTFITLSPSIIHNAMKLWTPPKIKGTFILDLSPNSSPVRSFTEEELHTLSKGLIRHYRIEYLFGEHPTTSLFADLQLDINLLKRQKVGTEELRVTGHAYNDERISNLVKQFTVKRWHV